jgi:hypothetical protein
MTKLGLIISNDWEVYGDGSGDYFEVQHKPLQEMLTVVEGHGAKVTVMAEVGQQWGHRELGRTAPWAAKVADAWEEIVRDAVRRKSDVQLHLHPQWINAAYDGSRWRLHLENWSIASLPSDVIEAVLRRGKEYLESTIKPVDAGYQCIAFRAGAYCIEPSSKVIPALRNAGIRCDTSVTKGFADPRFYDYRDAHSDVLPWLTTAASVKYQGHGHDGLLEMPIHSFRFVDSKVLRRLLGMVFGRERLRLLVDRLNFGAIAGKADYEWMKERDRLVAVRYPASRRPYQAPSSILKRSLISPAWLASAVLSRQMVQLDYDFVTPGVFVKSMRRVIDQCERVGLDVVIPVMSSGHVKTMHNCQNLDRILSAVDREFKDQVTHWTLREAVDYWWPRLQATD